MHHPSEDEHQFVGLDAAGHHEKTESDGMGGEYGLYFLHALLNSFSVDFHYAVGVIGLCYFLCCISCRRCRKSFYGLGNTIAGEVAASEIRDVLVGETTRDSAIPDGGLGATQRAYIVSGTEGMFKLNRTLQYLCMQRYC